MKFTCEDNMDLMSRYGENHFDLALVDIPYLIGASKPSKKVDSVTQKNGKKIAIKQANHTHKNWDFTPVHSNYFDELRRVSKRQIIFGGNYYGLKGGYLVWDKVNGLNDQYGCELAWLSFTKRTDIVYHLFSGMMQGKFVGRDIRKAFIQEGNKKLNEERIHPTQKPVKLYRWILQEYLNKGENKILDTHLGSGSIAIACHYLGLELTACEIDEEYFELFQKRFSHYEKTNNFLI